MKICDACENYAMTNFNLCASCAAYERKLVRDITKQALKRKAKPVKKVSEKRKDKLKEYVPLKAKYLKEHPQCQLMFPGICIQKPSTIHHASMSDLDFLNIATWMGACLPCHTHLETKLSAKERREKGYLI